jgi:HlyD family secretion protein
MKKKWKWLLLVFALAGLGGLFTLALRPSPVKVETALVTRAPLRVTIDAEGKTRVHDRFVLAAPVSGRMARITLQRGDAVESGDLITRIEPLPLPPLDPRQLAQAKAQVAAAQSLEREAAAHVTRVRATCDQARRERERAERLVESGDIARQEFERIRNSEATCQRELEATQFKAKAAAADSEATCQRELEATQFKAKAAAADVEAAQAALIVVQKHESSGPAAPLLVRAPLSGRVLRLLEESERAITAGTPLIELSNPTQLEAVIDVLSTDAVKIKPGARVLIENWGSERTLNARVRLVEPVAFTKVSALGVEEQRVNIIADFNEDPAPLGDGYRIEARIVLWDSENVLQVPTSALFRTDQGWSVFTVENEVLRLRPLETGQRNPFGVEVLQGISQGAVVVLHPTNQLADGLRVTTR